MTSDSGTAIWEERWHPLRQEWVIVAAHRQDRPWSGEIVPPDQQNLPSYADDCYLCPGNARVGGAINPQYDGVFVFDNDHPCVGEQAPEDLSPATGINQNRPAQGIARVVCYTARHDLSLSQLRVNEIENLLGEWQRQYTELAAQKNVKHVLVFENKGEVVGVSNPHPHCQIYATNFVFKTIEIETAASAQHLLQTGRPLFQDIIDAEVKDQNRIIAENGSTIAFLPYFARYAYEVYVAPKQTHRSLADLSDAEVQGFAAILKETLVRLDNLWRMSFPYVMALHQAPTDGEHRGFHFHIEIHPPLRKPNLLKYLAGPEIGGGNFLSDTSPEQKAAELRALSTTHYSVG